MLQTIGRFGVASLLAVGLAGCTGEPAAAPQADAAAETKYVVSTEPPGAVPVGEARQSAKDEQEITLTGRIGGSVKPFVEGLAAFTIVDPKVPHCAAAEGCPTPWDYCCTQNQVKENIATVKLVDENGNPVVQDAKELLDVEELSLVTVRGKAERDEEGNLSILADSVYVEKDS